MTAAIAASGLVRRYGGLTALDEVDVEVPAGSLCGLIGPNGAGKTTLLSILATLDDRFEGEAAVGGASVRRSPREVRRRMGFVPDQARVYEELSVVGYLRFFARAYALEQEEQAVERVLDLVGLKTAADRPAAGLSKGMTQRLSVGRALLHDPDVLILDEPASGLDPRARIELKQLLKKLQAARKTVLISSHILTELGDFCDRVVVVERGRVVADGEISELWERLGAEGGLARVTLEFLEDAEAARPALEAREEVSHILVDGDVLSFELVGGRPMLALVVRALVEAGHDVVRVSTERKNLEALFLSVTRGEVQ